MGNLVGRRIMPLSTMLLAGLFLAANARAEDACGICAQQIVINSTLATCFLDEYDQLAQDKDGAVAVDLSSCEQYRGVIEALKMPGMTADAPAEEPDVRFLLSQMQLACLKGKLEQPGLVLDPTAKIDLGTCG